MPNLDMLNKLGEAMGEVYAACHDRLLVNLARYFKELKPGEEPGGAFKYQAAKLAEMGQVTRESMEIIRDMLGGADPQLVQSLEAAILDAIEEIEPELRKAAEAGLIAVGRSGDRDLSIPPAGGDLRYGRSGDRPYGGVAPREVSPRMTRAFEMYYRQSADKLNLVNTVMLESTEAAYRKTVSDIVSRMQRAQSVLNIATGRVVSGVESFNQALRLAVGDMVDNGITGFVDHGGHRWRPETYVAMDMRTTFHNASREAFWERNEAYGNDLYLVSQHPGARPLCYPWQCKVISRQDKSRDVEDGAGQPVHVYAQSETTYGEPAGLFGINCGHHPELFIPGATMVPEVRQSEEENAKAYAESQKQRKLEREFRKARLDLAVAKAQGADKERIRAEREKVKKADERLERFTEETGRKRRREREYRPVDAKWAEETRKTAGKEQGPAENAQEPPQSAQVPLKNAQEPLQSAQVPLKNAQEQTQSAQENPTVIHEEQVTESAEKALTYGSGDDTIAPSTRAVGDSVREIATINNEAVFKRWGKVTPKVVLTDERIAHILDGHKQDYIELGDRIGETIETPTFILEDIRNEATALFVKRVDDASSMNVVVRIKIEGVDADDLLSSVITMYKMGEKTLTRLLKKNNILYKSP